MSCLRVEDMITTRYAFNTHVLSIEQRTHTTISQLGLFKGQPVLCSYYCGRHIWGEIESRDTMNIRSRMGWLD